ncbi:MAG: hypothetical protein AAB526_01000, partial [Patescibacteria group bacterium]
VGTPGAGIDTENNVVVYKNKLYVGTNDGHLYRYDGGTTWISVGNASDTDSITALGIFNGRIFVSKGIGAGLTVYDYNGSNWTNHGYPAGAINAFNFLIEYNGNLYAGDQADNNTTGQIYRYDGGITWTSIGTVGYSNYLLDGEVYNGKFYTGKSTHWYSYQTEPMFAVADRGDIRANGKAIIDDNMDVNGDIFVDGTINTNSKLNIGSTVLYSSSGEGWWADAAGNVTLQTPHDLATNEWIFSSQNINANKTLRVDMERLTKNLDKIFGGKYVFENGQDYFTQESPFKFSIDGDGNLTMEQVKAKKVITEEIEMKDKASGETWCTFIENGEWKKVKGNCGQPIIESAPIINSAPAPAIEPTPTTTTESA